VAWSGLVYCVSDDSDAQPPAGLLLCRQSPDQLYSLQCAWRLTLCSSLPKSPEHKPLPPTEVLIHARICDFTVRQVSLPVQRKPGSP